MRDNELGAYSHGNNKKHWGFCKYVLSFLAVCMILLSSIFLYYWIESEHYEIAGVPVLNYHQVNDYNYSPLTVKTKHFDQEMEYLDANGYNTITVDQLYEYLQNGTALPDKPVLITFDDGYVDNYKEALPILEKYGMKATLFMIGDSINSPRFLTAEELKDMERRGFEIQAHTHSHKNLKAMTEDEVREDIRKNKTELELLLNHPVNYLAYPGGFNDAKVRRITKEVGFKMAFTVKPGMTHPGDDLYRLQRLAVFEGDNAFLSLVLRLHMAPAVSALWALRDFLKDSGHELMAKLVPLF